MDTPQFEKAQYKSQQDGVCKRCGQTVGDTYYRINDDMACSQCAEKAKFDLPKDNHAAFTRALLFGFGGAILGLALYATFAIATGIEIGYVALAVGYIVATAMKYGSRGAAGRRYQIAAVTFTYAAVSMAAIPIGIHYAISTQEHRQTSLQQPQADSTAGENQQRPRSASIAWGSLIGSLILAGLASPFLELQQDLVSGVIGLVILYVGIQIAWKMMAESPSAGVLGPFRMNAARLGTPPQSS